LAKHPSIQKTLHAELDAVLGPPLDTDLPEDSVAQYDQVKNVAYLEAVINETLRFHTTAGIGLPRVIPEGGISFSTSCDYNGDSGSSDRKEWYFPAGAILSVPTYSLHRDGNAWGDDVNVFNPERWLVRDHDGKWALKSEHHEKRMWSSFNPFSYGPRACVGRNLAILELQLIIASMMHRYEFVLQDPEDQVSALCGLITDVLTLRS
jgi:benzoate 4-monooxygenase